MTTQVNNTEVKEDMATIRRQILEKAAREIKKLDQRQADIHARLPVLQSELMVLQKGLADREYQRRLVTQNVVTLTGQLEQARNYALYAQDTLGEDEAVARVRAAETALKDAQQVQAQTEQETAASDTEASSRVLALKEEQVQLQRERDEIARKRQVAEQVRDQALAELGEAEHTRIQAEMESYLTRVDAAKQATLEAQLALHDYAEQAIAHLQDWPEYVRLLKKQLPETEDVTTRTLKAELSYIDTLLTDGPHLPGLNHLQAAQGVYNWQSWLAVPPGEIWVEESLGGNPRMLRRRRQVVATLLAEYRARHMK